jgi:hypothetical protein
MVEIGVSPQQCEKAGSCQCQVVVTICFLPLVCAYASLTYAYAMHVHLASWSPFDARSRSLRDRSLWLVDNTIADRSNRVAI